MNTTGISYDEADEAYVWQKGMNTPLSKDFATQEFTCPCQYAECTRQYVKVKFIQQLQALRNELGEPIGVNSGFRCHMHQNDLSGQGLETATNSQHCVGNAADIRVPNFEKLKVLAPKYFSAIGTGAATLHVDGRSDRVRRWSYSHGM